VIELKFDGELSIQRSEELRQSLAQALARTTDIRVDLGDIVECDVAGLQLICSLSMTAVQRGQSSPVVTLSPAIEQAAAAIGLPIRELTGPYRKAPGSAPSRGDSSRGI